MITANQDLFVGAETLNQYTDIAPLIECEVLDQAFLDHDKAAKKAKRQYHRLGTLSILLVASSAIFTLAEALVLPKSLTGILPTLIAAAMAGVGIILQCYLIFTKQKTKWLTHRFASERIRSLKFQAYQLVEQAQDIADLEMRTSKFVSKNFMKLNNEMNAGISVLKNFYPLKALDVQMHDQKPKNPTLVKQAMEAYQGLRIDYQRNFALSEVTKFRSRRRIFNSTQDMIYLGAAIFAFVSLGAKISGQFGLTINTGWIDFLAVTLFVLGATEAIMDNATLEEQSQTRYEQYARDIDVLEAETNRAQTSFSERVIAMERICLNELDHFCRAADRISYRF